MCDKLMSHVRNIYIASAVDEGEILYCHLYEDGTISVKERYPSKYPSYLAMDGQMLYALLREPYRCQSGVQAYQINEKGELLKCGKTGATRGGISAHLTVHEGKIYVANYMTGTTIRMEDKIFIHHGTGPVLNRQEQPHPHCVISDPQKKYLYVADLGADRIVMLTPDLQLVSETVCPGGSGPRHLVFSPDGKYLYCINELSSTLTVFSHKESTLIIENSVSVLPDGCQKNSTAAAIRISEDGRYLYASNRGHDSICVMACEGKQVQPIQWIASGGESPRDIYICGKYLLCANENTDNVASFYIGNDGKLASTHHSLRVNHPWCILMGN